MSVMEFPDVLPYRAWIPYNYSKPIIFQATAASQLITFFICAYIHVGFDTTYIGMMMCVSVQVCVLEHRLGKIIWNIKKLISNDKTLDINDVQNACNTLIAEWIDHHNGLLRLSKSIHEIFSGAIFFQYYLSPTQICIIVYTMSNVPLLSGIFINEVPFLIATVVQIFTLCMIAHKVTLNFDDLNYSVYCIEWFDLNTYLQKSIVIIISKTLKPVIFKSGYFVTLSLESLKHVMKLSYSIYNLLQ